MAEGPDSAAPEFDRVPWLVVTGSRGKTTTVRMLAAMLRADGRRVAVGAGGERDHLAASAGSGEVDVVVVEFSRTDLTERAAPRAHASVVLNVADPEHAGVEARVHEGAIHAVVYNAADPLTEQFVRDADVTEGARAIGFTLGSPSPGQLGVVEDVLVDRAFVSDPRTSADAIGTLDDLDPGAAHEVANALAAAALARSVGVGADVVAQGLRDHRATR